MMPSLLALGGCLSAVIYKEQWCWVDVRTDACRRTHMMGIEYECECANASQLEASSSCPNLADTVRVCHRLQGYVTTAHWPTLQW